MDRIYKSASSPSRIAIIVDSPFRDLPAAVLLAIELCQQGHTCFLVPFNIRESEIGAIAPQIVLLPYLRTKIGDLALYLQNAGIKVAVLDTEGGVMPEVQQIGQLITKNVNVRKNLSCYMTWGKKVKQYLVKNTYLENSQVHITGTPRMDLYNNRWKEAILKSTSELDRYAHNLILFNGSFTVVNPAFSTRSEEAKAKVEKEGFDPTSVRLWQKTQNESLVMLANLANEVARNFPDSTVVYRPHPFENLETYKDIIDNLQNLYLLKDNSIYGWLLRAKAIVHRGSSTSIESSIVGIPALSPNWLPMHFNLSAVESSSIQCYDQEDLFSKLRDVLSGNFVFPRDFNENLTTITDDWFGPIDGKSYTRVGRVICKVLESSNNTVNKKACLDLLYGLNNVSKSRRYKITDRIRRILRLPAQWSFSKFRIVTDSTWDTSDKFFDAFQVKILSDEIIETSKNNHDSPLEEVEVKSANKIGMYVAPYFGRSVTIKLKR